MHTSIIIIISDIERDILFQMWEITGIISCISLAQADKVWQKNHTETLDLKN